MFLLFHDTMVVRGKCSSSLLSGPQGFLSHTAGVSVGGVEVLDVLLDGCIQRSGRQRAGIYRKDRETQYVCTYEYMHICHYGPLERMKERGTLQSVSFANVCDGSGNLSPFESTADRLADSSPGTVADAFLFPRMSSLGKYPTVPLHR
mgnify:FL=1